MLSKLVPVLFFFIVGITSAVYFVIACMIWLVTRPFDRRLRLLHLFTCFWGSFYTWIMPPWRIRIEGRENIRKGATYMVVSNHQSQLDILVAFRIFFHFKWVSKIEIFKIPIIGWNMSLNRYIKLKRGDKESIEKMMKECEDRINEGSSVYFFPEGTRSHDGRVKEFKLGAFQLAKKKRIPILPIVIGGTNKALPKYSLNFHGTQHILVRVCREIPYQAFADLTVEDTARMVREFIIKELDAVNAVLEGA